MCQLAQGSSDNNNVMYTLYNNTLNKQTILTENCKPRSGKVPAVKL